MANTQEQSLDETVWRAPHIVQTFGGIHTNSILPYFAESPFFDAVSNNAVISSQARYNQDLYYVVQNRLAFEERLRSMQGLEFMVTQDPSENGTKIEHSGVWVITKQQRRRRAGAEDEIEPISSYFVIGENVYMAPTVMSVLNSRLISTVACLTKIVSTATPLPLFTPSLGHTYLPPASKNPTTASSANPTQSSKESTPLPSTQDTTTSAKGVSNPRGAPIEEQSTLQTLSETLNLALAYGNEYMDSNPLVGEPGSFRVTRPQKEPAPKPVVAKANPFKAQPPKPIQTTNLPAEKRKGSKGGEKSPLTPGTALKDKKGRRKSKAAGAATTATTTPK